MPEKNDNARRLPLVLVAAAALAYCAWLGWHWLPLDYSDKEFGGFVSRLWDVRRELVEHHALPWWTPNYLSGSSYALHHSQALYLVPSLAFSCFFDLLTSVKLTALLAVFASAVAMYFCARHFLRSEWAALLAALAFLLHPEQVIRAAGAEHLGISVFMPFVPLTWLFWARSLESRRVGDVLWCALAVACSVWAHNKMALVNLLFLAAYLVYWVLWGTPGAEWRERLRGSARTGGLVALLSLCLGAFFIVPGLTETRHVKLFEGDPIGEWQKSYAFKSLLALLDRDGALTSETISDVVEDVNARGGARNAQEFQRARRIVALQTDSPEKYAGLVLVALLAAALLANRRRENRPLFWFFVAALAASVMLGYGRASVAGANLETAAALFALEGVPAAMRLAFLVAGLALLAFLAAFWRRKIDSGRSQALGAAALLAFLFVPLFTLVAWTPLFSEIRSPYVFYDITGAFLLALLAGFFVTDVVASRAPLVVALLAALLLVDYAPYQRPAFENGVAPRTLANLRAAYASLRADPEPVKAYIVSGRMLRLLLPMLGGKALAYEDFYDWMAPKGSGALNTQARGQPALFDLLGVRYVIFDKSDPRMAGAAPLLAHYRSLYTVHLENDDFVVLRNDGARPYLAAYARAARFEGDLRDSVALSLALSQELWPLIHAGANDPGPFDKAYASGQPAAPPDGQGEPVALQVESLTRETAGSVHAILSAAKPAWLVINESYYPYWHAALGGTPVRLYRASTGLMALRLPAGRHELRLQYSPPSVYFAAQLVSVAALLLALLVCWRQSSRMKRASSGVASDRSR